MSMQEIWLPLESRPCFLVKRGSMKVEAVQQLVNHVPGSIALWCMDLDAIKVIDAGQVEPLDRIAGAISEDA